MLLDKSVSYVRHSGILCEIRTRLISITDHTQPFEESPLILFMPHGSLSKGIQVA